MNVLMKLRYFLFIVLFTSSSIFANTDKEIEWNVKAKSIIAELTVHEKISLLMNESKGVDRLNIKPYNWWNEALHGVARNGKSTVFPMPINLASTFDEDLIYRVANATASEARAKFKVAQQLEIYEQYAGLTFWAPNINIFRDPRWGRGMETYGEDPFLTSRMGAAFVHGLQGDNDMYLKTAACIKHFAVHSGPEALRHEFDAKVSFKDLFETYLPAFRYIVKNTNVEAVMGAYNRVNGVSASANSFLLIDLLRNEWGFKGHVVSDCDAVTDIFAGHKSVDSEPEAAALAIKSGLNLECGNSFETLTEALELGLLTEKDIDNALVPLMVTRLKLGIIGENSENPYGNVCDSVVCCLTHRELSLEAAEKSIVLLQNKGDVLPIPQNVKTLYVTGPYATDGNVLLGNYYGIPKNLTTYLQGIAKNVSIGTRLTYKPGIMSTVSNVNPLDWASGESKKSDYTIVFLGESNCTEGEEGDAIASPYMGDRISLSIPKHQIDYLRALRENNNKKIITVVNCGGPFVSEEICKLSDAVIWAGYPGQEGGEALARILFGFVSPSGKLPVTFPESVELLPSFTNYSMRGRTYRYQKDNISFPFGYGLSYGIIKYGNLKILNCENPKQNSFEISIEVTNIGNYKTDEVVQVYMKFPKTNIVTPLNTLVGFRRVTLNPKEQKILKFIINPEQLLLVDENGKEDFVKGNYSFCVSNAAPSLKSNQLGAQMEKVEVYIN